jgi:long-chain acyl-CoA synthetase
MRGRLVPQRRHGRTDEDGYFFIVDRKKDLIIRGGYNVYPREVEEVLYEHPKIREAAVVGVPHDEWGEEIGAAVVLHDGEELSPRRSAPTSRSAIAAYKYPRGRLVPRRAAEGPDRQDPQARDRGPAAPQ